MTQRIQILSKCANVACNPSHATKSHRRRREKMRIPPLGARTRPQRASSPPRILCGAAFESSLDLVFFAEPPQASSAMLGVTLVQCFAVVMIGTYGALSLRLPSRQRCRQAQRALLQAHFGDGPSSRSLGAEADFRVPQRAVYRTAYLVAYLISETPGRVRFIASKNLQLVFWATRF